MEVKSSRPEDAALILSTEGSYEKSGSALQPAHPKSYEAAAGGEEGEEENEGSSWRGIYAQLLVAGAVFLLTCGSGFPIGYSAILLPQLQAENSTLPTDEDMGSWIASVHSAATPVGSFLSGYIADRWGRREAMRISIIPFTVGWGCIAMARSHWVLLLGRVLAGLAVGISAAPSQVMLGEVAEPKLRGLLAGSIFVSYSMGILIVYALGSVLDWTTVAGLACILPLASLVAFTLLPESPVWLARNKKTEEARRALFWLRGGPTTQAKREFHQLTTRIEEEFLLSLQNIDTGNRGCLATFSQPQVLKPFSIVIIFHFLQIVSGTFLIIFYAVDIIMQANEEGIDSFFAAVLTSVVRFVFTIVASVLLFYMGRRPLGIASGLSSGVSAIALATILYLKTLDVSYWDPATEGALVLSFLLIYIATNTCGFFVLPGVTIGEFLPAKVRGMAGGYIFCAFNIGLFAAAKMYPYLTHALGAHGIFFVFGGSSLVGTVLVFLFLPETKGKSLNEIEDYFKQDNVMWITRDRRRSEFTYA